jgi:anti-sigma B factor antagonist
MSPPGEPTPSTRFDVVAGGPARTLAVTGEIDIATAPDLDRFLRRHLAAVPRHGRVVVDLTGVRLLGAAGVDVLVGVAHAARAREVAFALDPVSWQVARVLDLCGLDLAHRCR